MTCRQCGTEIAEKALICYKCGTATTEAKFKPATVAPARSPMQWVVTAVSLAVLVLLVVLVGRSEAGESSRTVSYVAVGGAVAVVLIRAYLRRRR